MRRQAHSSIAEQKRGWVLTVQRCRVLDAKTFLCLRDSRERTLLNAKKRGLVKKGVLMIYLLRRSFARRHIIVPERSHAETTWKDIVREEDYSTFHVADYDPDTGDLVDKGAVLRVP